MKYGKKVAETPCGGGRDCPHAFLPAREDFRNRMPEKYKREAQELVGGCRFVQKKLVQISFFG
jgi:hypothetical protein